MAQFYVIHSNKGDSEEQDANVSDSDESLKLPQLPNWRMSSVKSQAKLFQLIMPGAPFGEKGGHTVNHLQSRNHAVNFQSVNPASKNGVTTQIGGGRPNVKSTKNLSLPPLKKQIQGLIVGDQSAAAKFDDENGFNPQYFIQGQVKNLQIGQHISSTTAFSIAAAKPSLNGALKSKKLQPLYYHQAKRLKGLRSFQNSSIEPSPTFESQSQYRSNKDLLRKHRKQKFNNTNLQAVIQGNPNIDEEFRGNEADRRKTQQPEKMGAHLETADAYQLQGLIHERSPSESKAPLLKNHVLSIFQSPSVANSENDFRGGRQKLYKENAEFQGPFGIEERKDEDSIGPQEQRIENIASGNPRNSYQLQGSQNENGGANYAAIHFSNITQNTYLPNTILEKSPNSQSKHNQNQPLNISPQGRTHARSFNSNNNNGNSPNLISTDVGTYKTALLISKMCQKKTITFQFPDSIVVKSSSDDIHSLIDVQYLGHQGTKLISMQMEPQRDLDQILQSWLNMNLSKSQSGILVPIAISKQESIKISNLQQQQQNQQKENFNIETTMQQKNLNFFIVTAHHQFQEDFIQVQQSGKKEQGFLMQRYVPQRGQSSSFYRAHWNSDKGFKFHLFRSRYTYNGHLTPQNVNGEYAPHEIGADRQYLRGKKFISFEKFARLFNQVTQQQQSHQLANGGSTQNINNQAHQTAQRADQLIFSLSQRHMMLQQEIYTKFANVEQQFKIHVPKQLSPSRQMQGNNSTTNDYIDIKIRQDTPRCDVPGAGIGSGNSAGTYRLVINSIQKSMIELIQALQDSQEVTNSVFGSPIQSGSIKRITVDFIEDYQSEAEAPLLFIQRIVNIETSPPPQLQEQLQQPIVSQNVANDDQQPGIPSQGFTCQGEYCYIQRSPFIPRHLAPILADLIQGRIDHPRVPLKLIQEDRKLLKLIQSGEDYQTALKQINDNRQDQIVEGGVPFPERSTIANNEQLDGGYKNPINNEEVVSTRLLRQHQSGNQQQCESPLKQLQIINPSNTNEDQDVDVCPICFKVYSFLEQLRISNNCYPQPNCQQNQLNSSQVQRSINQPFISIHDNQQELLNQPNGSQNQYYDTRSDPMRTFPLNGEIEDDFDETRVVSGMNMDESLNRVGGANPRIPKIPSLVKQSLLTDGDKNLLQNAKRSNELLLVGAQAGIRSVTTSYNAPLMNINENNINGMTEITPSPNNNQDKSTSSPKPRLLKKSCTIQTFTLAEIIPNITQTPPKTGGRTTSNKKRPSEQISLSRQQKILEEQKKQSVEDHSTTLRGTPFDGTLNNREISIWEADLKRQSELEKQLQSTASIMQLGSVEHQPTYEMKVQITDPNMMKLIESQPALTNDNGSLIKAQRSIKSNIPISINNNSNVADILNASKQSSHTKKLVDKIITNSNLIASLDNNSPLAAALASNSLLSPPIQQHSRSIGSSQELSHISFFPLDEVILPRSPPKVFFNNLTTLDEGTPNGQKIQLFMVRNTAGNGEEDNNILLEESDVLGEKSGKASLNNSAKKVLGKVFQYQQVLQQQQKNGAAISALRLSAENGQATQLQLQQVMPGGSMPKTITLKADSLHQSQKIDSFFGRFSEQEDEYLVEYIASINDDSVLFGQSNKSSSETPFQNASGGKNSGGIVLVLSKNQSQMNTPKRQIQQAIEKQRRASSKQQILNNDGGASASPEIPLQETKKKT